jgi:hypothetical protein
MRSAVTRRHLGSGDSLTSLLYNFNISKISVTVPEVCGALTAALQEYSKLQENLFHTRTDLFCNFLN